MKLLKVLLVMAVSLYGTLSFANYGPWQVRLRALDIIPYPSTSSIPVIKGHVNDVSNQVVPELDFSYFLNCNVAAELILAVTRHNTAANGTILGHVDLGSVSMLPPTLTLQYHFLANRPFQPYVGVGLNYTYFFNANHGPVATNIKHGNSFGPALQAGIDYYFYHNWLFNVDIKKVYISTDVALQTAVGRLTTTVHLNPLVIGAGIGYRF